MNAFTFVDYDVVGEGESLWPRCTGARSRIDSIEVPEIRLLVVKRSLVLVEMLDEEMIPPV
jgi:hypothetical protein